MVHLYTKSSWHAPPQVVQSGSHANKSNLLVAVVSVLCKTNNQNRICNRSPSEEIYCQPKSFRIGKHLFLITEARCLNGCNSIDTFPAFLFQVLDQSYEFGRIDYYYRYNHQFYDWGKVLVRVDTPSLVFVYAMFICNDLLRALNHFSLQGFT